MLIPDKYEPELLSPEYKSGYFNWSLDFFTDTNVLQVPYLDITIQLDVTDAYAIYQACKVEGATFFAFLLWHLAQTLKAHLSFNLRWVDKNWYILNNPPVVVPVAVGGKKRFWGTELENVAKISYADFVSVYRYKIDLARSCQSKPLDPLDFSLGYFIGNLSNLQFTGLTLQWRQDGMIGQPFIYFGKRYVSGNRLMIPLAVKLHHACADPLVLDLLLQDFQSRFS